MKPATSSGSGGAARHIMILASAGSGKTYALTSRFVALLAEGARPERIVALTFTRKAAGEFFDEILHKLSRAACDERFAAQLAHDIGRPALRRGDFLRLLREVVDAMPRLRLGTLDSFFARIARAFPLELGLSGEFEVLQEHAARLERRRVLQRLFARAPQGLADAQREFIEAFKRATFGTEEKRLGARLDAFLDDHQETFLAARAGAHWGDAARIWPDGCEWLEPPEKSPAEAATALRAALAGRDLNEKQRARWDAFFAALPEWSAGAPLPDAVEYILKNTLAVWGDVRRGCAELTVERKKVALSPAECRELALLIRHLVGAELTRQLETTRGIHAVLHGYENVYHDAVRRSGKLTFGDVQRLLLPPAGDEGEGQGAGGPDSTAELAAPPSALSLVPPIDRLAIDWRLDAQFDHWLLDEFQDTSFGQWSVLRNLIDEAVQDPTGARSFFCVGDVKQAIYTWREGDPRLFGEIFAHYTQAAPGTIAKQHLVQSWRSGPPVIALVNAIFGRGAVLAELFPGPATQAWNAEWRDHESARPQLGGHAAWLHVPATGAGAAADEAERHRLTVQLLHELAPLERGLTCAVLTQTNAQATALADHLRREGGIPALAESDLHVCTDNPLGAGLLALAQAAAHPGDTLAQEHWRMTPLREVLREAGIEFPEQWTQRFLTQVHTEGFERTMDFWLRRAEAKLAADDVFSRERGRQFVNAAALFDQTGSRDVAEFVAFMERHTARDAEVGGVVRVMTIHKSKGLGFDVVVLPELEGQRIDQRRPGLAVQRSPERAIQWILELPPKLFYAQDETLRAHVEAAEAEACYEALALLYVAFTRAKRALYAITKAPGKSESRNYPKILASTLGTDAAPLAIGALACTAGWSAGDPHWHRQLVPAAGAPAGSRKPDPLPALRLTAAQRAPRRPSQRPSGEHRAVLEAAALFAIEEVSAADFGTSVHALLAQIEWGGAEAAARLEREGRAAGAAAPVLAQALACLRAEALAAVWRRPPGAELWRERAFEIVLEGTWITGVFDRVVVERDAAGRAQRATVFDFKTDAVPDEAALAESVARHAAQLNLYRRVVAALTGLALAAVRCEIVFTRRAERREVPAT